MAWEYYEDLYGDEPEKPVVRKNPTPPKQDLSSLILLGLGIFAGYVLFSDDKKESKEEDKKPLDPYDKAVANKIEIHGNPNILVGGRGDRLSPSDVSPIEYAKGLKVEREHTKDKEIASEIALDHLAEDDQYYTHLESIHKENPSGPPVRDWFNENTFSTAYEKFNGNYAFIAKYLLGRNYSRLGNLINNYALDWIEKYPRKDKILKGPYHDPSRIDWKKYHEAVWQYGEENVAVGYEDGTGRTIIKIKNPIKDARGGLTAEGRRHFKETEGANLKPGVMKVETLEDLKRWGQWARRFFGRSVLPPLKNEKGEPTRLALDAQAWGCKIPKTKKEAKVIAKRGSEALKYYKELKKQGLKKNDSVRFKICHD